jgi:hypothetical protein
MASNIINGDINTGFPVAGVDNDSQGFRDNFSRIESNFVAAYNEITDLQNNTAKLNAENNFQENYIIQAVLKDVSEEVEVGEYSNNENTITLTYNNASIHKLYISNPNNTVIRLEGWPPAGKYGKFLLHIFSTIDGDNKPITIETPSRDKTFASSSDGDLTLAVDSNTTPLVLEIDSYDEGNTIFIRKTVYILQSS